MNRQIYHPLNLLIIGMVLSWLVIAPAQAFSFATKQSYKAWIADNSFQAGVKEPFSLLLGLDPADPPSGYYVSVLEQLTGQGHPYVFR